MARVDYNFRKTHELEAPHMAKRIDPKTVPTITGTEYPKPYDTPCIHRERKKLGEAAKLSQFGVNLLRLPPGTWSSQRHWHTSEDEFVFVVSGEVVLVSDDGEELLRAGDCAGFKANDPNGHHLQNRSTNEAFVLEIGGRDVQDGCSYPGIDMFIAPGSTRYAHLDGTPYPVA